MTDKIHKHTDDAGVAVIGMSGRFPGARDISEFWNNLREGKCSITAYSEEQLLKAGVSHALLKNKNYVKAGYPLDDPEYFDAAFFGFTPREAECLDPQHRLFLECAWSAFDDAGYNPESYNGPIGVYAGCGQNGYFLNNLNTSRHLVESVGEFELLLDSEKDFLATRAAYKMNLTGPAINVQSACSTSLVAVCLGFQALMTYQCDMALCGGVSLIVPSRQGYLYKEGMIFSPDGYCRAFDAGSGGTVQGEGVGAVLLKRLDEAIADGDHIYAVIKGAAVNNDGSVKAGFTAPSIDGQAMAIRMAQRLADISPDAISFIEAHGTGTPLGDPIEVAALTRVFREKTERKGFCALGAVKTNIGHLDAASGIAGFIKTVLSLYHKTVPPTLHYQTPNPRLDLDASPFYINTSPVDLSRAGAPLSASVSSFGIGGTNAHVVLEEAPAVPASKQADGWQVLPVSAKSELSLLANQMNLAMYMKDNPSVNCADCAFTMQAGRKRFNHRSVIICRDSGDLARSVETGDNKRMLSLVESSSGQPVVFMFTGQGSQHAGMTAGLYRENAFFREIVDYCSEKLRALIGLDLRDVLYPKNENDEFVSLHLARTDFVQPALFVIEYAMARLWMSWGITPAAFIGHSIGEYVAACLSGVFSLDDALEIVAARGKFIQAQPEGSMLSVPLSEKAIAPFLHDGLTVAVVNGESLCVVSGSTPDIRSLENALREKNTTSMVLPTSHAFHSELISSACGPLMETISRVRRNDPAIPYISNVSGTWIRREEAISPSYYGDHLRGQVKFYQGAMALMDGSYNVFLEMGPGNTLCTLVNRIIHRSSAPRSLHVISSLAHPLDKTGDMEMMARALGKLWMSGAEIDWNAYYRNDKRKRVSLPSYSFNRKRYWIDGDASKYHAAKHPDETVEARNVYHSANIEEGGLQQARAGVAMEHVDTYLFGIWSEILGVDRISIRDSFFDLGGNSLMATQLVSLINERLNIDLTLTDFFFNPTIAGLIETIKGFTSIHQDRGSLPGARLPVLFPIQPRGDTLPLYIIAGVHENRYYDPVKMKSSYEDDFLRYLSNLIPHIGMDQPVFGLRPKGLVATETPHQSVKEMAAAYIMEIRKFQPEGPYLIAGECVGGIVAYEMAQQLRAANQTVAHLIMMDTHCPTLKFAMRENYLYVRHKIFSTIRASFSNLRNGGVKALLSFFGEKVGSIPMLFFPLTRKLRITRQIMLRGFEYQKTLLRYRPVAYEGDATMLLNEEWHGREPDFGWEGTLGSNITIIEVPGDHLTRLTTYGETAGTRLREVINRALEKYAPHMIPKH